MKPLSPSEIKEIEVPKPLNETQRVLAEALKRLGPNGENWHQGSYCNGAGDRLCALGAVRAAQGLPADEDSVSEIHKAPYNFLGQAASALGGPGTAWMFNDSAESFSEVRAMFEKAIELSA